MVYMKSFFQGLQVMNIAKGHPAPRREVDEDISATCKMSNRFGKYKNKERLLHSGALAMGPYIQGCRSIRCHTLACRDHG